MKLFSCPACDQVVFFSNVRCERCGHALGYEPAGNRMLALEAVGDGALLSVGRDSTGARWRRCANHPDSACNWLVPADGASRFCLADRHNLTIPDLSDPQNVELWRRMEAAKHRLFYSLLRLDLPLQTRTERPDGLGFRFLADDPGSEQKVMTGHDEGLITIALVEADDAEREKRRTAMNEPYRTLLGHFRHEVGHWYWNVLVRGTDALGPCRAVFGDDTQDYGEALRRHYADGPRPDWQDVSVSPYAGSHPWEDFAETWAHYLHIVDTLEVGRAFGMTIRPELDRDAILSTDLGFDVYDPSTTIEEIAEAWLPVTQALNSMNRAMGLGDLYPFVLSPGAIRKLGFIHDLVHGRISARHATAEPPSEDADDVETLGKQVETAV